MNKLTKVLSVFILAGVIGTGVAGAAGCKHKHKYADDYTSAGESGHYRLATCKHTDEHTEIESHEYDNDQDTTCNKCDYVRTVAGSEVAVTEVSISGADTVEIDKSIQLTAVITPSDATNKTVSWDITEGADLAELSADGLLTAYSELGTVKVKVTVGGKSASKTITITEAAAVPTVESVTISGESTVKEGEKITLTATVNGTGNPAQTVTWSSSDTSKATVNATTGEVTGVAGGTVTITATSTVDTSKSGTKQITVTALSYYEKLCAQSNKIYNNEFSTAADRLPDFGGTYGAAAGVYTDFAVNSNTAGATAQTHYVKVEGGKATQVNPGPGTAYTVVDFGAINGDIEGYVEVTLSEAANGMTFVQFIGDSAAKTGSEVFGLRTDGGNVKYRLDGSSTYVGADPAIATATQMSVYFKFASGKMTVTVNDNVLCKDLDTTITKLVGFRLASGDSNTRTVNADNVVFCGEMSPEGLVAAAKTTAIAYLNSTYPAANYTTTAAIGGELHNKTEYETAISNAEEAINAADSIEGVEAAKQSAKTTLDAIKNDAALAADYAAGAKAVIDGYKSADISGWDTDSNTDKNDAYTDIGSRKQSAKTAIDNAASIAAIQTEVANAEAAIDQLYNNALVDIATLRTQYKTQLTTYANEKKTENSVSDAIVEAAITAAVNTIDTATKSNIADIDAAAKTRINFLVGDFNTQVLSLREYATTAKSNSGLRTEDQGVVDDVMAITSVSVQALLEATSANLADKVNAVKAAIDTAVYDTKNQVLEITLTGGATGTMHVYYGTVITPADICITAKQVTAASYGGGTAITEAAPLTVYANTIISVTTADYSTFDTNKEWTVGADDVYSSTRIENNGLFAIDVPASAVKLKKGDTNGSKAFNGTKLNNVTYNNVVTLGNISQNTDNKNSPLIVTAKSALKSLTIYTRVAESTGDKARAGKTYYYVNGVLRDTENSVECVHTIQNLNAGDVITVWAENTGSGGHFYLCKVEAEVDSTNAEKGVTVNWMSGDGTTVWQTTTHTYFETITAPDGTPTNLSGTFNGWKYNGAAISANLKLPSSATAYVMIPDIIASNATITFKIDGQEDNVQHYTVGATGGVSDTGVPDPAKSGYLFLGWYDGTTDEAEKYDFTSVTDGTDVEVYAKFMAPNIHITYKETSSDAGETVDLFKLADGSIVDANKQAATLKAAPEATDPTKPHFDGWFYTPDGGTKTKLELNADLAAGTYTVIAEFSELTVTEMPFFINDNKDAATTYATVASGSKFEENALFDITANTAFEHYKGTDSSRAKFTPNDGKERNMLNGSVIKMSTAIATSGTTQFMTIKANAKIQLKVYVALSNASWGDNSTGDLTYKVKQTDGTYKDTANNTAYSFASRGVTTVTITLEKDEELELSVGVSKTNRFIYFGGAEATVVT